MPAPTYWHATVHFAAVAPGTSRAWQVPEKEVVVAVVSGIVVVVAVVGAAVVDCMVGAGVGEGPDPEPVTAMSAQFQNSSPKPPPVLQQALLHVAQLEVQNGHQSSAFQPRASKAAELRWK